MTLLTYVVENTVWSLAGFAVGYLLGQVERIAQDKEAHDDDHA